MSRLTPGPTTVTVELNDPAGNRPRASPRPLATLTPTTSTIGDVRLRNNGPGVYEADVVIPAKGRWRLAIALQTDETTTPAETLEFLVG